MATGEQSYRRLSPGSGQGWEQQRLEREGVQGGRAEFKKEGVGVISCWRPGGDGEEAVCSLGEQDWAPEGCTSLILGGGGPAVPGEGVGSGNGTKGRRWGEGRIRNTGGRRGREDIVSGLANQPRAAPP